jgi:imidazolonepropionase-like amidohydrolase
MLPLSVVVALALALAGSPVAATSSSKQGGTLALKVEHIVKPDGTLGPGGWIVVKGGRLESVGGAEAPAGAAVVEFPHGVASPGFIDPVTALGATGDLAETARAFTPEVQAGDAFDADHSDFRKAAAGGITTVGLSPSSSNVVGGHLAIVRTSGEQGLAVLTGSGPLRFALTPAAFDFERAPTSRMGALPQLRELLAGDKLKSAGPCLVDATTPDEIRVALETFGAAGRQVALLRPNGAIEPDDGIADLFKGTTALAVVGPFSLSTSMRTLALPQTLSARGVAVAFTSGGNPGSLRLTAALAVRGGLPAEKALQALTAVPARVLGLDDCGSLEAGKRADLLVFDGDPLDLGSPLKLVLVGGAPQEKKGASSTERSKGTP